jgi:uncharacterized protein
MRRRRAVTSLTLVGFALALGFQTAAAQEAQFPQPTGHVVDQAGLLQPNTRAALEGLCRELKDKTGAEIAAALVPSIAPLDIDTYSVELFERWGVGGKDTDEGALFVVAREERRVRIEVGYGLEGILPDGKVGGILRSNVVPFLREDNWDAGVAGALAGLAVVIAEDKGVTLESLAGGNVPQPREARRSRRSSRGAGLIGLFFLLMFLGALGGGRRGRRGRSVAWLAPLLFLGSTRGGFGGGFGGGGGGGFGGFGGGMSGGGGANSGF